MCVAYASKFSRILFMSSNGPYSTPNDGITAPVATSKTNDWSGPQVSWQEAVIPVLTDYFENAVSLDLVLSQSSEDSPTPVSEPEPESKSWMVQERIKASKKKVTASQRLHIDMEAAEAYKERHLVAPAKEQVKGKECAQRLSASQVATQRS